MAQIKVAVVGACGRMGREVVKALSTSQDFEIVAAIDREMLGSSCRDLVGPSAPDVTIEDKLGAALDRTKPDAIIDFTHASSATAHALSAITRGISPVIG